MFLDTVYVRHFKSFNFDYLRQDLDGQEKFPWDVIQGEPGSYYPFVKVTLEHDITTVVGANESGKSQLISAIQCLLGASPIVPRDFCRYSRFFGVRGSMPLPEFGGQFRGLTNTERQTLGLVDARAATVDHFWFFRLRGGPHLYLPTTSGIADVELDKEQLDGLPLPIARRIDADVVLPSSASLFDLEQAKKSPDRRDRSAWLALFQQIKAFADDPEEAPDEFSTLVPAVAARPPADEERSTKSLSLVRDLLESVAEVDTQAYTELLNADAADDGYASALTSSVTDALDVSLNFSKWWSQDRDFSLQVHKDGFHLVFTLKDKTGQTYTFDERSGGMQYFLSYFIQREAYRPRKEGRSEILLMDEPDAYLSTQGQQDLMRVFARYAFPDDGKPPAQVVYVTHSPFLIDKNYPQRIRVLQKGTGDEGTRIVNKASIDKYEPLRTAFSSFHADTAFIGTCNLLVEGPADLILFSGVSAAMRQAGTPDPSLDLNRLTMVPVHGASNYRYMVHLTRGRDLDRPAVIVLLDSDKAGHDAGADLDKLENGFGKKPLLDKSLIFPIDKLAVGKLAVDVTEVYEPEDLVPTDVARRALVRFATDLLTEEEAEALTGHLQQPLQVTKGQRLFDQAAAALGEASAAAGLSLTIGKIEFAHAVSAIVRGAPPKELAAVFKNFGALFEELNQLQEQAMGDHTRERVKEVTKRIVDRFKRDHKVRARKETVSKLLLEVEAQLEGAGPDQEAVRSAARRIRDEFDLGDSPLGDVDNFPALREQLTDLVLAPERAAAG